MINTQMQAVAEVTRFLSKHEAIWGRV